MLAQLRKRSRDFEKVAIVLEVGPGEAGSLRGWANGEADGRDVSTDIRRATSVGDLLALIRSRIA